MNSIQSIIEDHERIRACVRALASERRRGNRGERERLRARVVSTLEQHFKREESVLHPALADRVEPEFLSERVQGPSDELRRIVGILRTTEVSDARFPETVDELGRLLHRYLLHEEALVPVDGSDELAGRRTHDRSLGACS